MKKSPTTVSTTLLRVAFVLVLIALTAYVPLAIGGKLGNDALKAQATRAQVLKDSARADVASAPSVKPLISPETPQVCTINGVLGTAPVGGATGVVSPRLFRPATAASTCAAPTVWPGSSAGSYVYNVHYITNPNPAPLCTSVTLHYVSGGTATVNMQHGFFQSPFAPADMGSAARYLADPEASSGNPPIDLTFSYNVPAGATVALVVWNANASPAGTGAVYQLNIDQDAYCGPPAPQIAANGSSITAEGCNPPNMAVDPGETVTVNLNLKNNGGAPTTNLVATLLATGGVTNPSAPVMYGVIAPTMSANGSFTFTADGSLTCGSVITATLMLSDNGNPLPNVTFTFTTGALVSSFSENFDAVAPPALPAGWTADQGTNTAGAPMWETSNAGTPAPVADTAPNATFSQDPANLCDNRLYTPVVMYSAGSTLFFRQNYDLEQASATQAYDAGVLEMSVNGGAYQDILTAGGTFASGGYNHPDLNTGFGNPLLPVRPNWSGISNGGVGGFETCAVNLPAAAAGMPVQFRWRMGSDNSVSHAGWRVDSVSIAQRICCTNALSVSTAVSVKTHGGAGDFSIDLPLTGNAGVECRAGGANNDYTIKVTFSGNVAVTGTPQATVTMGTATIGTGGVGNGGMVTVMGNMVLIPLTNVADQQTITVRLNGVTGASGSDVPAVDFDIPMSRLLGDSNGNRAVNASDVTQVKGRIGQAVTSVNFRSDLNANGSINAGDASLAKANSGHAVP